ncbi:MAG: histidine phosphatase family protein [Magnetococcales bacterium]|nr:histidine phosphatase family protein [Magnetococcales bacterium]
MLTLHLLRHLQTDWNRRGVLQGWQDTDVIPPDENVQARIAENRAILTRKTPSAVYVSALKRTHQTARHHGFSDVIIDPRLNECHFGPHEKQSRTAAYASLGDAWIENPLSLTLGEPMTLFQERILAFINGLDGPGPVVVFSHGAWIRALISIVETGTINTMNQRSLAPNTLTTLQVTLPLKTPSLQ